MTKRKSSWLLLEWFGTVLLWLLPDTKPVNRFLSKLFYWVYNDFHWPDLENPQSFNEKLICEKISDEARSPERQRITDKHWVKAFVDERLGPGHTVPTLGIISDPKDVDTYEFPLPCVVKPTHSSQEVSFLDKAQPDKAERKRLKYWLWKDYFAANREPNYKGLEHKLIIEPIVGGQFGALDDVKLLCFGGEPKLIQVDHGRFGQHARDYYDIRGQLLPVEMRKSSAGRPFPFQRQLPELLRVARALS